MPTNVLLWNVEQFGAKFANNAQARYFRTAMMAAVVLDAQVDVVVLQEVRSRAFVQLQELINALEAIGTGMNYHWNFDWLPGSITGTNSPLGVPTQAQLAFCPQGNSEGYAVVYRTDHTVGNQRPLAVVEQTHSYGEGGNGGNMELENLGHYIEIVSMGQRPQYHIDQQITVNFDFDIDHLDLNFPLNFPHHRNAPTIVAGDDADNDANFPRGLTRRPCAIYLNAKGGGTYKIVCQHSPVQRYSAQIGTQMTFGSAQLLNAPNGHGLGGDFNLAKTADRQGVGDQMTNRTMQSNINPVVVNERIKYNGQPSSVRAFNYAKTSWLGQGDQDYLTTSRDLGAARLTHGQAVEPSVFDPVDSIMSDLHGQNVWNEFCVGASADITGALVNMANLSAKIGQLGTGAQLVEGWMLQHQQPPDGSTMTTCVAYMVRTFLSDHSPVRMTFD